MDAIPQEDTTLTRHFDNYSFESNPSKHLEDIKLYKTYREELKGENLLKYPYPNNQVGH